MNCPKHNSKILLMIIFFIFMFNGSSAALYNAPNFHQRASGIPATPVNGSNIDATGNHRIYVILAEFPSFYKDCGGGKILDEEAVNFLDYYDSMNDVKDVVANQIWNDPTYSMKNYYDEDSYGKLSIVGDETNILATVDVGHPKRYYGYNNNGTRDAGWTEADECVAYNDGKKHSGRLIEDAVWEADILGVDFAEVLDQNNDGMQDDNAHLLVIYPGYDEAYNPENENNEGNPDDIWPVFWNLGNNLAVDGVTIHKGIIVSIESKLGIYVHEFGHSIGASDIYDLDGGSDTEWDADNRPVYTWGLMANGEWGARPGEVEGTCPTHNIGYHKHFYGWIDPITITSDNTVTIRALENNSENCLYKIPIQTHIVDGDTLEEYFLIENRHPGAGGTFFDTWSSHRSYYTFNDVTKPVYYPLDSGILITHIDERGIDDTQIGTGLIYNSARNGKPYTIWVEDPGMVYTPNTDSAEKDYEYKSEHDDYWIGDIHNGKYGFYKLNAAFSAEDGQTTFSDDPHHNNSILLANSRDNDGNPTDIFIRILDEADEAMRVEIGFDGETTDITPPELTHSIYQNDGIPQDIDLFVIADETLSQPPTIQINDEDLQVSTYNADENIYWAEYTLTATGDYEFSIEAIDKADNSTTQSIYFSATQIKAGEDGFAHSHDGIAQLYIPAHSFRQADTWLISEKVDDGYQFSSNFVNLVHPAKLTFNLTPDELKENPGIYRFDKNGWEFIGNQIKNNTIFADIKKLGIFTIKFGDHPEIDTTPKRLALHQNFPNPANPNTTIRFDLPYATTTTLKIYDSAGRLIKILASEYLESGTHLINWDGTDESGNAVSSGIYHYQLNVGDHIQTKPMLILK